jgi:acetate kinase
MTPAILVLNAGSSSIKFALYGGETLDVLCRGDIEKIGGSPRFKVAGTRASDLAALPPMPPQGTP